MRTRVKICGITSVADALAAVESGADALGFMFYEASARCVSPEIVATIVRKLPPFVARVGVFVDAPEETVRQVATTAKIDTLQFHGEESPGYCQRFSRWTVYKAFRVQGPDTVRKVEEYGGAAWLLDSYVPGRAGGTGEVFSWDVAVQVVALGRPVILAGGLAPANVVEAVRRVRPWAVDVSSGVESEPGRKDPAKMRAFIEAVRSAD